MGTQQKQWLTICLGSKITADGDCSHEIKRHLLLGRKVMTNLDSIFKSRDITCQQRPSSQGYVFPNNRVWMWEFNYKDAEKNWCFWTVVLEKTLESSWRSNQSILNEICPGYSLEGLMLKLKLQYFGYLMRRPDSFEKTLMPGKIGGRRRDRQRKRCLDCITDLMDMSFIRLRELVLDRKALCAAAQGVAMIQTWLSNWTELNWDDCNYSVVWTCFGIAFLWD